MRQAAHAILAMIGVLTWLVAYFFGALSVWLAHLGDWVWPEADMGNCWSYALPRWNAKRGALVLVFVEDARFMKVFPVVHCIWMPKGPGHAPFEMTQPVERRKSQWFPWWAFYFKFRVVSVERRRADRSAAPPEPTKPQSVGP